MGGEDPSMIEDMPDWSFFFAQVDGEIFGFDLRDMAQKYEWRGRTGETPVMINPTAVRVPSSSSVSRRWSTRGSSRMS